MLLQLKKGLEKEKDEESLKELSTEFYDSLRFRKDSRPVITTVKEIAQQQDFCQVDQKSSFLGPLCSLLALFFRTILATDLRNRTTCVKLDV